MSWQITCADDIDADGPGSATTGLVSITVVTSGAEGLGASGGTSSAFNTTGANLIILAVSWYYGTTADVTVSDSKSNTYAGLTAHFAGSVTKQRIFYCAAPTVGTGHTFTVSGATTYSGVGVVAVSGAAASPFDLENGNTTLGAFTLNTGSITPSQNNEIVIASICTDAASNKTLGSGFTYHDIAYTASNWEGGGIGYKIQTTAAAVDPSFTWDTTQSIAAAGIACFKAA